MDLLDSECSSNHQFSDNIMVLGLKARAKSLSANNVSSLGQIALTAFSRKFKEVEQCFIGNTFYYLIIKRIFSSFIALYLQ